MGELERTGRRVLIVSTANLQRPLALAAAGPILEGDLLDQDGLGGGYEGSRLLVGVDGPDDGDLPGGESVVLALHQARVGRGEPLEGDLVELKLLKDTWVRRFFPYSGDFLTRVTMIMTKARTVVRQLKMMMIGTIRSKSLSSLDISSESSNFPGIIFPFSPSPVKTF